MAKTHHQWLASQLPLWVKDELIDRSQSESIEKRYPLDTELSLWRTLLSSMGAIMIGLGVILLFAYNWQELSKAIKLTIIFGVFIAAHLGGLLSRGRNLVLSEGLFVLGTMLMGSAIFLVGQIYHLDSHYPDAILLWGLGALIMAWVLPSLPQAFMALAAVLLWHLLETMQFHFSNTYSFLLMLLAIAPLVWHLKSPVLARFTAASLLLTVAVTASTVEENLILFVLMSGAAILIFIGQLGSQSQEINKSIIAAEIAKPGWLVLIGIMLLFSFNELSGEIGTIELLDFRRSLYFWIGLVISQFLFIILLLKRRLSLAVLMVELVLGLVFTPSLFVLTESPYTFHFYNWIAFNSILLILSLTMMTSGAKRGNRRRMVYGTLLFAVLAAARYTDMFDSLVERAIVFLVVGVALFIASNVYQRNKKSLEVAS